MSTNHHTAYVFGGPLTSAAMEAPLGQLDAAIASVIATGSGTATTLTAQALAGQASLTVASSAGFAPGDPIYIGTGATFESRIVNTVPNGTTITVTVNLSNTYASGTPVTKSPIEIVDARGSYTTLGGRVGAIEGRVYDAKRYGAKGDGATDDRAAIQAAIDAANAAGGGIVFLPPGNYLIASSAILVKSNVLLAGSGWGCKITQASNNPCVQFNTAATKVGVRDLQVVGTNNGAHTANYGVYGDTITDVAVENVYASLCERGIVFTGSTAIRIDGCRVVGGRTSANGTIDLNACFELLVAGCHVSATTGSCHGIDVRGQSGEVRIIGNHLETIANAAIVLSGTTSLLGAVIEANIIIDPAYGVIVENTAQRFVVAANSIFSPSAVGILISNGGTAAPNGVVANNVVRDAGDHGIHVFDCSYIVVSGNRVSVFVNDGIRINGGAGANLGGLCLGNIVTDGSATTGAAIRVLNTGTAGGFPITGNLVRNTAGYGIRVEGTERLPISGNTVIDADNTGVLLIGGISIDGTSHRCAITGNSSYRTTGTKQDHGVHISTGATNCLIVGNNLYQNTTSGILDNGTGTTSANNITT